MTGTGRPTPDADAPSGPRRASTRRRPDAHLLDRTGPAWPTLPGWLPGLLPRGPRERPVWSCHAIARALVRLPGLALPWEVVHGDLLGAHNHSWLACGSPHPPVPEAYPVATLTGPALHDAWSPVHARMFAPRAYATDDVGQFEEDAAVATALWSDRE